MTTTNIGDIIREARERQGITQEELCGCAMAVSTLSRIENNRALPSRKIREYICQKLDISELLIPHEVSKFDEEKLILEIEIRRKIRCGDGNYNYEDLLNRYKEIMSEDSSLDRQFFMYASAVMFDEKNNNHTEAKRQHLEALSLTFPNFTLDIDLTKHHFSSLEITLMNCIALKTYYEDKQTAMSLMRRLKEYCEMHLKTGASIMNNYPSILFNVQNWEGFAENWEEAYKIASMGVDFCLENGDTFILPNFFIDKGWNAFQLGRLDEARKCIVAGCAILKVRGDKELDSILENLKHYSEGKLIITKDDF